MNPLTKRILLSPRMWPAAAWLQMAKIARRGTVCLRREGLRITCGTAAGQGSFCAVAGAVYEPELPWLVGEIKAGDTFVDVGANIGIYSLHAAKKMDGRGRIFAIEPSPEANSLLSRNISSNGFSQIITAVPAAASAAMGQLFLGGDPTKWNSLQLHLHPPGVPIRVTTVDNVLSDKQERDHFHFLKIDAEGVETDVLAGASESIQTSWPAVIFENSINRSRELPTDWLRARGYEIFAVKNRRALVRVLPRHYASHVNLVALHPRSRAYVG